MVHNQSRDSHEVTQNAEGSAGCIPGFSFPLEELYWSGGGQCSHHVAISFTPSIESILVFVVQGML